MKTRQPGFGLVELLVVMVLATVIMGAAYQSLVVQDRSFRTTGEIIRGQDALRTALGVLEAELREVVTDNDVAVGGADILAATRDSVVFRAQRILAFVCEVGASTKHAHVLTVGSSELFAPEDGALIFADDDPSTVNDDGWIAARINSINSSSAACPTLPGTPTANQRLGLKRYDGSDIQEQVLNRVRRGAPVRGVERVTYGLYESDSGWYLGRRSGEGGPVQTLVSGLDAEGSGLVFTYLNAAGNALAVPVAQGDIHNIVAVRISASTRPQPGTAARATTLTTHIHLRNN
jgi:prepilin-type N-terminal cleavage/methylation domain-containing protein